MEQPNWKGPLGEAFDRAVSYLEGLPDRRVPAAAGRAELTAALGGPLPERPTDPRAVIAAFAAAAEPGVMASGSGNFFGFVVGGVTPAALAADWLTSTWDQNAGLYVLAPAAAVVEEVAAGWLADLLGLPAGVSAGFVTGVQMANVTGMSIGVREVLRRVGWDAAVDGLWGAPKVRILAGNGRHDTIDRAARHLGAGTAAIAGIDADDQGRMMPAALRRVLQAGSGPALVCAQVGNVNTGAVDPVGEICAIAREHDAWVHVDGAFGMWASASPRLRPLVHGIELADSWATDAHKMLNVPYDSGLVFCAHPAAHRAAMGIRASYLIHAADGERDALDYGPEFSRRARGFAVYAALRSLGRSGVAELVERCCGLARRFAERLAAEGVEVLNEVTLNQVLVRFRSADGDHDAHTRQVLDRLQRDGACWMSGTTFNGMAAVRISVSNWSTDADDVDRAVAAMLRHARG